LSFLRNPSSLLETIVRLLAKAGKVISPHKMDRHLACPSYKKKNYLFYVANILDPN
jgi:hypothetical protein